MTTMTTYQCCPMDTYDPGPDGEMVPTCTCPDGCACYCLDCSCDDDLDADERQYCASCGAVIPQAAQACPGCGGWA